MGDRYVVSLRNQGHVENKSGLLNECKSILQEIGCIIKNWDEFMRGSSLDLVINEISAAENILYDTKRKLWLLSMSSTSKIESRRNQDERGALYQESSQPRTDFTQCEVSDARLVPSVNRESVVRANACMPVSIHQRETTKRTLVINNSPSQIPLKNLLLSWSVMLDVNHKLCLRGTLPTEGEWMTSPIAVRLGQTTVKTSSGTVYNLSGPMVVPKDENIPNFVQEKFRVGFPIDWAGVLKKWVSHTKKVEDSEPQKNLLVNGNNGNAMESTAYVVLHDIRKDCVQGPSESVQTQEQMEMMPPPRSYPERQKVSVTPSRISPQQAPLPGQEIPEKTTRTMEMEQSQNSKKKFEIPNPLPRHSKRILTKSLLETSMDNADMNESASEQDIKMLKMWTVDFSKRYNGLMLKGSLVNENGDVVVKSYTSTCVCRRVTSDLVETEGGQYYRLVGPSSLVFSDFKEFDYGFPVHWQKLISRFQNLNDTSRTTRTENKKSLSFAQQSNVSRSERINSTANSVASTQRRNKRQSLIQHLIRHQISQGQTSMSEGNNNGTLPAKRSNLGAVKRKVETAPFVPEPIVPIKKKMSKNAGGAQMTTLDDSLGNESEYQWKEELVKNWQSAKNKKAEPGSTLSKANQEKPVEEVAAENNPRKSPVIKRKDKAADKYILGLATDCDSEFDFNIF